MKSAVTVFIGLSLAMIVPAFPRSHHKHPSSTPAYGGSIYAPWKPPYELPPGVGPNDIPFAPF